MQALPSNRVFGWRSTAVFSLAGAWSTWTDGVSFALWFTLAAVMAALAYFVPDSLETLNRAWAAFVEAARRALEPVALRALMWVLFNAGALKRRLVRHPARQRFDPSTYWADGTAPGSGERESPTP